MLLARPNWKVWVHIVTLYLTSFKVYLFIVRVDICFSNLKRKEDVMSREGTCTWKGDC